MALLGPIGFYFFRIWLTPAVQVYPKDIVISGFKRRVVKRSDVESISLEGGKLSIKFRTQLGLKDIRILVELPEE